MKSLVAAFWAEALKVRKSKVFGLSIVFFIFVAFMMGLLMFVQIHPEISAKLGMVGTKAAMLRFGEPDWQNYFALVSQSIAAIGLVGFGFVTSWIFGREYSDKTLKDILALPVSRSYIVFSKFLVIFLWCVFLGIVFYSSALIAGKAAGISNWSHDIAYRFTTTFTNVAFLSILLCTPVAFFASISRGYLLPFAFIIMTLLLANFSGIVGLGPYFPWAIPGIISIPSSEEMHLKTVSYIILLITSLSGYLGTLLWWRFADQK
jgi:ABC-2 type transport system permease protein